MSPRFSFLFLILIWTTIPSIAQNVHWTGKEGDGEWINPGNWDLEIVPGVGNDVFIDDAQVSYKGSHTIKSLTMSESSVLAISGGTPLNIVGSNIFGISLNKSQIIIEEGSLSVMETDSSGIVLENGSEIIASDSLIVSHSGAEGVILQKSFLQNRSVVLVDSTRNEGVVIDDGSVLENRGEIIISRTIEYGLINTMSSSLENESGASIKIHSIENLIPIYGMLNYGVINNHGSIEVFDLLCPGIYSLETTASINNHGLISVDNALFGLAALNSSAVDNTAGGTIRIRNVQSGIGSNGLFTNSGKIIVDSTENGIILFPGSDFISMDSVIVSNITNEAIENNGKITNSGLLSISHSEGHGIYSNDTIINNGSIEMNNNGDDAFLNEGYLENHSRIIINQAGNVGLLHEGDGVLKNESGGIINITDAFAQGLENYSIIKNNGSISTTNSGLQGIYSDGLFANSSVINISNTGSVAISNRDTIQNSENGTITVLDSTSDGIANQTSTSFFSNEGRITIFRTAEDGIVNNGTIIQLSTGNLQTYSTLGSPFIINAGALTDILGTISLDDGSGGN